MNLEIITMCERYDRKPDDGRLNLYGLFDFSVLSAVPGSPQPALLYVRLRGDAREKGAHLLTLSLVDADGHNIMSPVTAIRPTLHWESHDHVIVSWMVDVSAFVFPDYGQYAFHVQVEQEDVAVLPYRIDPPAPH